MSDTVDQLMKKIMNLPPTDDFCNKAFAISRQIIELKPAIPHYYCNHALFCADFGYWEEAIEVLEYALKLLPGCPIIRRILTTNLLQAGRFKEGLEEFEYRFDEPLPESPQSFFMLTVASKLIKRYPPKPRWNGKDDISDKTVLVFNEGGLG